jgi:hypothetical protein
MEEEKEEGSYRRAAGSKKMKALELNRTEHRMNEERAREKKGEGKESKPQREVLAK